jgi:polygalacturonase
VDLLASIGSQGESVRNNDIRPMTQENGHSDGGASRRDLLQRVAGIGAVLAARPKWVGARAAGAAGGLQHPGATPPAGASGIFDVLQFGATGNGQALDTPAINRAIEAAAAAGGGVVRIPAGQYLCYSIHLRSNITIALEPGAAIIAADTAADGAGYDSAEPNPAADHYQDFGHTHFHNSLIWGEGLHDIAIVGPGLIWGRGLTRGHREAQPGVGDKSIALKNCHTVILRDFGILHGGHFGVLATGVDNLTVDNVTFDTNRDGIDIDCCWNVRVSNCSVNSPWDDGICLKSSFGLGYARATRNVTIANCYVTGGWIEGTLLDGTFKPWPAGQRRVPTGRIKLGTESNGGFQNIAISNCIFESCRGLALESVDGALLEDISISNIAMRDIRDLPIFMRLGSRMRGPQGAPVGQLRRVSINNIVASNTAAPYACIISGIPGHAIEAVRISDVYIQHQGGGTAAEAALQPPEKENAYPEPTMFGRMPAFGFFVRHVSDLQMTGVEIATISPDMRPAFVLEDVQGADFVHIKTPAAPGGHRFLLRNVGDFNLYLSRPLADTHIEQTENKEL